MQKGVMTQGLHQQHGHEPHHGKTAIHPFGIATPAKSRNIGRGVALVGGTDRVEDSLGVASALLEVMRQGQECPKS